MICQTCKYKFSSAMYCAKKTTSGVQNIAPKKRLLMVVVNSEIIFVQFESCHFQFKFKPIMLVAYQPINAYFLTLSSTLATLLPELWRKCLIHTTCYLYHSIPKLYNCLASH